MHSANGSNSTDCFDLQEAPAWTLGIYATLIAAITLTTMVGDGLVLLLVARYKQLRCRSVIVILSVIATDILFALSFHVPIFVTTVTRRWPFTARGCAAFSFLGLEFLITRWYIMGVLSIDRFCTVRSPFSYPKYSKLVVVLLTAVAWVLPIVLGVPSVDGFLNYSFRPNLGTCLPNCHDTENARLCRLYYAGYFSLAFIVGGVLPIVLYIWLYRRARKLRPASLTLGKLSVEVASGAVVHQPIANLSDISRDFRALVTVILIFVTLVVTGLPAYVLQIVRAVGMTTAICKIPTLITYLVYALLLSSTALDPLVIMRDRDFRHCLRDLFCCHLSSHVQDVEVRISRSPSDGLSPVEPEHSNKEPASETASSNNSSNLSTTPLQTLGTVLEDGSSTSI